MSDQAYAKVQAQQKTLIGSSPKSSLLQRTCACGQHTIAGGECEACRKKREGTLQRAAIGSAPVGEAPPIVQEVLRSPKQPLDTTSRAFMEPRFGHDFSQIPTYTSTAGVIQTKLAINKPGDEYEREADRIADQVLAAPAHPAVSGVIPHIQRFVGQAPAQTDTAPASVDRVLASVGRPLGPALQQDMGQRFGHDFSQVRIHTDEQAAESARAVNALAYTVGGNVVFGQGQYAPGTREGKRLLAHELTHVVQQSGSDGMGVSQSNEKHGLTTLATAPIISRASPDAVGHTMGLGKAAKTGIQFSPTNVTDTRVGPVTVQGGLLSGGASRLNVIISGNLTLRALARQLLPLWITATPFTPPGAVAPLALDIITEDELAQGLLVYNQTYLPVPAMTNWRSGLRLPLPVEIDGLGVATLHPLQIRALAGAFDPAWAPLLDLRTSATTAAPAAVLQADVTAFLARETTALARGMHLGSRALTNAVAELPFVVETFRQLGAASFDVALAFMDGLLDRDISLLASQRDGAAILAAVRSTLAAAPATPTAAQQASLSRANLMLGRAAAVAAQAPPGAARTRAEKTITVDTVKLDGSSHNPSTDVAMANAILSQCNVRVAHGVNATATHAQTIGWLGGNIDLHSANNCASPSAEEHALFQGASATFGFGARFRAFFPATFSGVNGSGYSCIPSHAPTPLFRNTAVVQNDGDTDSLAHELGHILINLGPHTAVGLMSPRPALPAWRLDQISDAHCTRLHSNA